VATDLVRFSRWVAVSDAGESLNFFKGTYVMGERSICVSLIAPSAVSSDMQESPPEEQPEKSARSEKLKPESVADLATFILTRPGRCAISSVRIEQRFQR
jgi:NADP-dependent 3-hydroxy acid dehydrogenase YdfG